MCLSFYISYLSYLFHAEAAPVTMIWLSRDTAASPDMCRGRGPASTQAAAPAVTRSRGTPAVQYSTVQYSTVQYSTVQYSTVQYSRVQYSTVQYSTVQDSAVLQGAGPGLHLSCLPHQLMGHRLACSQPGLHSKWSENVKQDKLKLLMRSFSTH